MQLLAWLGSGVAAALRAGTTGAGLAAGFAGVEPFTSPAITTQEPWVPTAGTDSVGTHFSAFGCKCRVLSLCLPKSRSPGSAAVGFLPQWESKAELSKRTGVTCVPNS